MSLLHSNFELASPVERFLAPRRKFSFRLCVNVLCHLLVIALLVSVGRKLFWHIKTTGMSGVDTFVYWKQAKLLLSGELDLSHLTSEESVARATTVALNTLSLALFGVNDYALRLGIGLINLLNIVLVYCLALRISRNAIVSAVAAALYALNRFILIYAATELPHIYGTAFFLLSAHCALSVVSPSLARWKRIAAAGAMGFFLGSGALTHEDLIILAAGLALGLLVSSLSLTDKLARGFGDVFLKLGGALALGGVLGVAWPMAVVRLTPAALFWGLLDIRSETDRNTLVRTAGHFVHLTAVRIWGDLIFNLLRVPLSVAVIAVVLSSPFLFLWRRDKKSSIILLIAIGMMFYLLVFIYVLQIYLEGSYVRILIPATTLMMVLGPAGGYVIAKRFLQLLRVPFAMGVGTTAAVFGFGLEAHSLDSLVGLRPPISPYRLLYDATKEMVTLRERLLLPGCYALPWDSVGIGSDVYLGHRVVPLYLAADLKPFDAFVAAHSVRYVLVSTPLPGKAELAHILNTFTVVYGTDLPAALEKTLQPISQVKRPPEWWLPAQADQVWHGETRVDWSVPVCEYEAEVLRALLTARGASVVVRKADFGEVYKLPTP